MIKANDTSLSSWIGVTENSDFPIQNIPFGVFKSEDYISTATRIGDTIVDLAKLADLGYFKALDLENPKVFAARTLNGFIALGKESWSAVRNRISELFRADAALSDEEKESLKTCFFSSADVEMLLPVHVGDYTDFYSSIEHATNIGIMFRDPNNALLPNWKHIPVGYHGRSSSIVVSGAEIHRPKGQTKADDAEMPSFGPSRLMDFELEMAFVTGGATQLGETIPIEKTDDHIFGMLIFNDLSARDIQKWEYVPLGPFLGKNFGSVVSPWIVTMEALEPFRVAGPKQDPEVLPYLKQNGNKNLDIHLETYLQPEGGEENKICESNTKYLYWSVNQQLAHQTVNGCNINDGDMYASGTISGPVESSYGSMMELSWKGTKPIKLSDGTERKFMQDNDSIIMRAFAKNDQVRIGFGESRVKLLPARD